MSYREDLESKYGARMFVPDLAREFGIQQKTIHNQVSTGRFPVETYRVGNRRCADTVRVAAYLEAAADASAPGTVPAGPPSRQIRRRRSPVTGRSA